MSKVGIGLLGLGTVGGGTVNVLQRNAEELTRRIDGRLDRLIAEEESRSFADYRFLVVAGDPAANYLQPSPLASFPVASDIPGLLGYFQVDSEGEFWIVNVDVVMPLFNAGARQAGLTAAESRFNQARLAYEQSVIEALREVSDALNQFYKAGEVLEAELALQKATGEYLALATKRYRNGVLAYLDVLDAQRDLSRSRTDYLSARYNYILSVLQLEAAVGETGQVVKVPVERQPGIVRFTTPLLGSDEWPFVCEQAVELGDRVYIKEISGNTLVVQNGSLKK